jgi:hypothetical protein
MKKFRLPTSRPFRAELMYKGQRLLQIVRWKDRKVKLLEFWEFLDLFVRDLYANQAIVEFGNFQAISVSVT